MPRILRLLSVAAVLSALGWVMVVIQAFAQQCYPVSERSNLIGNLYVLRYNNTAGGAAIIVQFNAANGVNVNGLDWIQFVLNDSSVNLIKAFNNRNLRTPYVDFPNGGYGPGGAINVPADNKPFYYPFGPVSDWGNQINRHRGPNFVNISDFPVGGNVDFVTHLVRVSGMNYAPLICFRWGFNFVNGNTQVTPGPNVTIVPFDNALANVVSNEFPGWQKVASVVAIPALGQIGIVVLAALLIATALWVVRLRGNL